MSHRHTLRLILLSLILGVGPSDLPAAAEPLSSAEVEGSPIALSDLADELVPVPEPSAKALQYYRSGIWLWLFGQVWAIAVPAAILVSGLSARLRNLAQTLGRHWYVVFVGYVVLYLVLVYLINRPLAYYVGFVRPHAYDLSNLTLARWFTNSLKSLGVSVVTAALFLWVPYFLMLRSPRRWWFYTGLLTVPFLVFVMLVSPVVVDPLFNTFGPMTDKHLEAKILALAERAGIDGGRVFEVDKSRDTQTVNAYVTGIWGTKRIVLWDTLLEKLDDEEVLVVMGHEMGHYVLGHVVRSILLGSVLTMAGLFLVHVAAQRLLASRRLRAWFGFDRLSDVASVPLLLMLIQMFTLAALPLVNTYSRYQEAEADRFALELTRANRAGAMAFVKLQQENLSHPRPHPLIKLWRSTHPSIGERVDFFNAYRPWRHGAPLQYASRFRDAPAPTSHP